MRKCLFFNFSVLLKTEKLKSEKTMAFPDGKERTAKKKKDGKLKNEHFLAFGLFRFFENEKGEKLKNINFPLFDISAFFESEKVGKR